MANIRLVIKTIKDPVEPYIRFHSSKFDISSKSGILIRKAKFWSNRKQAFNSVSEKFPKRELMEQITNLKNYVIDEYNRSYTEGENIDKPWLDRIIDAFHNRAKDGEENESVYFIPFVESFINDSIKRINTDTGNPINKKTIDKYGTTLKRLYDFEEFSNVKLRHKDIGLEFHSKFVSYLKIELNYGNSTIEKFISQIKTFCREVEVKGYPINPEFKSRKFTFKRQKPLDPYLTKDEVKAITELDIKDSQLRKIRDLFIIGIWTGLRISDFKQLKRLNVVEEDILIAGTKKTTAPAIIPIHPEVKKVIDRNSGIPMFNVKSAYFERLFNREIKNICKMAEITQIILGDKRDTSTNRNVRGLYPKYELVSSHICRRTFCTLHYGKLPNQAIMAITTHSSEKQFLDYVKIGKDEYIEEVREYWMKQEAKNNA